MRTLFLAIPFMCMVGCASHMVEKRFNRNFFHFFQKVDADERSETSEEDVNFGPGPQDEVNRDVYPYFEPKEEIISFDEEDIEPEPKQESSWW